MHPHSSVLSKCEPDGSLYISNVIKSTWLSIVGSGQRLTLHRHWFSFFVGRENPIQTIGRQKEIGRESDGADNRSGVIDSQSAWRAGGWPGADTLIRAGNVAAVATPPCPILTANAHSQGSERSMAWGVTAGLISLNPWDAVCCSPCTHATSVFHVLKSTKIRFFFFFLHLRRVWFFAAYVARLLTYRCCDPNPPSSSFPEVSVLFLSLSGWWSQCHTFLSEEDLCAALCFCVSSAY